MQLFPGFPFALITAVLFPAFSSLMNEDTQDLIHKGT